MWKKLGKANHNHVSQSTATISHGRENSFQIIWALGIGHWALSNQKLWQLLRLVGICQRFWWWGSSAQSWPCWSNMNKIWGLQLHKLDGLDWLTNELVVSFFFVKVGKWGRAWYFLLCSITRSIDQPWSRRCCLTRQMFLKRPNVTICCNDRLTIRVMMRRPTNHHMKPD